MAFCKGNIQNNTIYSNGCINHGGGIAFSDGNFQNNTIYSNLAYSSGGGLAYCTGNFLNNVIYNNTAQRYTPYYTERRSYGGGFYDCSGTFKNNVIYDNWAEDSGGGLFMCYGKIKNSIIWGNRAEEGTQIYECPDLSYNCIQDWDQTVDGNMSTDPAFVNPLDGDFHLSTDSPCIDSGDPASEENDALLPPGQGTERNDMGDYGGAFNARDYTTPTPTPTPIPTPLPSHPVIHVPRDYSSIQEAINAASDGYEIVVFPGRYVEDINFMGKNIILRSVNPDDIVIVAGTIIHSKNLTTIVTFKGTESKECVLSGLSIAFTGWNPKYGGGINGNGTHATIEKNKITNCSTTTNGYGGGIYKCDGLIRKNILAWNKSRQGGALSLCNGTIDSNRIFKNLCLFSSYGGGLNECNGVITNNEIYDNASDEYGGGLYGCNGYIISNNISNNSAGNNGGGIENCHGYISGNIISGNIAGINGGGLSGCDGYIMNNIIIRNTAQNSGGGLYSCNNIIQNNTIYANIAESGGGLSNCLGVIENCIIWNNSSQMHNCSLPSYSCIEDWTSGGEGNISNDPMFLDPEHDDFHLQSESPCIDTGDPDPSFNDESHPPGSGSQRNDMGAYGGQMNYIWLTIEFPSAIAVLTEYGDIWAANNYGVPPFGQPMRRGWLGFRFDPENYWYPLKGNADGSGIEDIIQVTEYGDVWVARSSETEYGPATRWGWLGFRYEETTYKGWIPLSGDVDGTGSDDLIQVTEWGDAWVAISTETSYAEPTRWGWLGYRFNRGAIGENGAIPLTGDANGDGICDLIQITEYTDAWVALSAETMYNPPTRWGWLGFKYAPYDGWYPLCGDVSGDGLDDLVQITPTGDPWVALSAETMFLAPTRWGWLSFYYDEAQGYYPLLGDVNADGKEDLIQITPGGEQWVSLSTGEAFETPEKWGWLGFTFSRENGYMPFYLDY